jgi:hypothetical protein
MVLSEAKVDNIEEIELEIFRSTSIRAAPWQPGQCFELSIVSPYANEADYKSFSTDNPPICSTRSSEIDITCNLITPQRI